MNNCIHCNQIILARREIVDEESSAGPFCCEGCLAVYKIINSKGLGEYYNIKQNINLLKKRSPVEIKEAHFQFLDDPEFISEYAYKNHRNDWTMEFYLEGIHCLACLWIIEKMPEFVTGIKSSTLNISKSTVTVTLNEGGSFALAAKELNSIGYRPHPLKMNQEANDLKIKEERSMLLKIGIAAAASGNIMLYAVSLYAGAGHEWESLFNLLTVIFAIPVMTYCSFPFYKSSYHALKNKTLNIDVPISMALLMGLIMGLYNLFVGIQENYFDSLTALVFLLLLSRYFLKTIQEKGLSTSDLHFFYQGDNIIRLEENHPEIETSIHPKQIKSNDLLKILPNQLIPADGVIVNGSSYLNNSLLTGESLLLKVSTNDEIFTGTLNVSNEIIMRVKNSYNESRLGKILKDVENSWGKKGHLIEVTNIVSKYFIAAVFMLALILFIIRYNQTDLRSALELSLTLLIVTCPCALAIATPLTFIRSLSKSAVKGIIIKDDLVIETLAKAKTIFIDKTGTLTENKLIVSSFKIEQHAKDSLDLSDIVFSLEKNSKHPVAQGLKNYFKDRQLHDLKVTDYKEITGMGVEGYINNNFYQIKDYSLFENGERIASFSLEDSLRPDSIESLESLRSLGLQIKILSGDKKEIVERLAKQVQLSSSEYEYELSPEEKSEIIKNSKNSIMVGDGANDAIALSHADTGIAVFGAMDISLRAEDVYLNYPGINPVAELIKISRETMKVIYRNFALSLAYNSVSVVLVYTGYISPLTAAIVMPVSSLTVLISTIIGTKELRKLWK